jgi:hypothetical protein
MHRIYGVEWIDKITDYKEATPLYDRIDAVGQKIPVK